jgi:hypothetical protein
MEMTFEVENKTVKVFANGEQIATRKLMEKYGCFMINFCGQLYTLFHEGSNKGFLIKAEQR